MFQDVARSLGETKVNRLIQFYTGPDAATFGRISERNERGETLSEAEISEMGRMLSLYPVVELAQALERAGEALNQNRDFITAATRCSLEKRAALVRLGLRGN
jgi:hypothetical protein